MRTIVFSKDRALQLDAFLRSYADNVRPSGNVHVLYRASSPRHEAAYEALFQSYSWVRAVQQSESFKADVLDLLRGSETNVIFFVDDQVFLRAWSVMETSGLSLRLGTNLTRDYVSNDAMQPLPTFAHEGVGLLSWCWGDGALAWGYPLSLDGHVFDLAEFRSLVEQTLFYSPNTLEAHLQRFAPEFRKRRGLCYTVSKVVNVPWNMVQTDWHTRHAEGNGAEEMLKHWEHDERIPVRWLYGMVNQSTHQEFPLALEDVHVRA